MTKEDLGQPRKTRRFGTTQQKDSGQVTKGEQVSSVALGSTLERRGLGRQGKTHIKKRRPQSAKATRRKELQEQESSKGFCGCAEFKVWAQWNGLSWLSDKEKKIGPTRGRPAIASEVGLCKVIEQLAEGYLPYNL